MEKLNKDTIDSIYSNYIDEVVIGNNLAKYCLLKDENEKIKIFNNFACGPDGLIPQPWLGNILNPKIVILGKNPGFVDTGYVNDITDNAVDSENSIRDYLIANLENNIQKRKQLYLKLYENEYCINSIKWVLADENQSSLSKWWKDFFTRVGYNDYKNIRDSFGDDICIINYYGYYSKSLDGIIREVIPCTKRIDLNKIVDKASIVVYLWDSAKKMYEDTASILNDYPLVFIGNKNVEGNSTGRYTNFYNTCCYDNKNNKVISKEEMSIQKKLNELQN